MSFLLGWPIFRGELLNFRGVPLFLETSRLPKNGTRVFHVVYIFHIVTPPTSTPDGLQANVTDHVISSQRFPIHGMDPSGAILKFDGIFLLRIFSWACEVDWSKNETDIQLRKETCFYIMILIFKLSKKSTSFFGVVFGYSFQSRLQIFDKHKTPLPFHQLRFEGPKDGRKNEGLRLHARPVEFSCHPWDVKVPGANQKTKSRTKLSCVFWRLYFP